MLNDLYNITEEQLEKLLDDLEDISSYNIDAWLFDDIRAILEAKYPDNIKLIENLFNDYYETSLIYLDVKPLENYLL